MPKLVFNYMRLMAILLLIVVSIAIIISYCYVPSISITALSDFYRGYWHLLTLLFFIAFLFLIFAVCSENNWSTANWWQHLIAFGLLGWFVKELITLVRVSDILFAFTN